MKKILLLLSLATIVCCKKEKSSEIKLIKKNQQSDFKKNLPLSDDASASKLETFVFPSEIEGCSCYFAKNRADFEAEKYVYVDDNTKSAFVKQGGKLIKIPMKKVEFDPQNFSKKIQTEDFTVQIEGEKIKTMEEVMMFEGTMTVEYKNGEKAATSLYGECGC